MSLENRIMGEALARAEAAERERDAAIELVATLQQQVDKRLGEAIEALRELDEARAEAARLAAAPEAGLNDLRTMQKRHKRRRKRDDATRSRRGATRPPEAAMSNQPIGPVFECDNMLVNRCALTADEKYPASHLYESPTREIEHLKRVLKEQS